MYNNEIKGNVDENWLKFFFLSQMLTFEPAFLHVQLILFLNTFYESVEIKNFT